ncbi:O-antigen ligase domain-containing protein [Atopobacter sp. AH10]|uniref:O-antigen ligase family protein n=1 Tax=Atopobacter sp. AH10 TaxID=2315861 RepID=UPI000EF197CA|nr:O-antigen ligase family protein [Atopobacter sp. AH10]RLK63641.1 O-antigen ligase domain-containing protein [Atopobacter sp. AH10]
MKKLSVSKIEWWSKLMFCLLGIINCLPVVYDWIKPAYQLATMMVFLITSWLLWGKKYRDKHFIWLFALFLGTQFLATFANARSHLIGNLVHIVFVMSICLITLVGDKEVGEKLVKWLAICLQFFSFACSVFALALAVSGLSTTLYYGKHVALRLGFHGGRLFGLLNPNGGALLAVISMTLAVYLYRHYPQYKKALMTNMALQFIYFSLQQSRGALLCAMTVLFLLTAFVFKKERIRQQILLLMTSFLLLFSAYFMTIKVAEKYGEFIRSESIERLESADDEGEYGESREFSVKSGSRSQIWVRALKMGQKQPVFGYGFRNIKPNMAKFFKTFKMKEALGGGFHNIFLTVFVASGMLGLVSFIVLLAYIAFSFSKYILLSDNVDGKIIMALALAYLPVQLVESIIMYSPSGFNIIFWFLVGIGFYYNELWMREGKNSETLS